MTVEELMEELDKLPADASVCLSVQDTEALDFTVELSDDGFVVLED